MRSVIKTGKTIDEAVEQALLELGANREEAEIEVLEDSAKGLFGIGAKEAKVKVSAPEKGVGAKAKGFLETLLYKMGIPAEVSLQEEDKTVFLEIKGENMGLVIGRRGDTLDAISYLTTLVANKGESERVRIIIDTENYRGKRKSTLEGLARRMAGTAVRQHRNVTLDPMNPYERRIVHEALQGNKNVTTYSVGDDPFRKVVIAPVGGKEKSSYRKSEKSDGFIYNKKGYAEDDDDYGFSAKPTGMLYTEFGEKRFSDSSEADE